MSTIKGARAHKKPASFTDGPVFDKSVNYPAVKVELMGPIAESQTKHILGGIVLFPGVVEKTLENGDVVHEDRKHWISFDHLGETSADLFPKFYEDSTCTFVNACKVGVSEGRVFLAAA